MTTRRITAIVLAGTCFSITIGAARVTFAADYAIDILSNEFIPFLNQARMGHINNHGVVAGSVASNNFVPFNNIFRQQFVVSTYRGNRQFEPLSIEGFVVGFSDNGVIAGSTRDGRPLLLRNGIQEALPIADTEIPSIAGVTPNGIVYGSFGSWEANTLRTFTYDGTSVTTLPIMLQNPHPGFGEKSMNSNGLISVRSGYLDNSGNFVDQGTYLYDVPSSAIAPVQPPQGWTLDLINEPLQVTSSTVYGVLSNPPRTTLRYGSWNKDGSFRDFVPTPPNVFGVNFNDLGHAAGVADGTAWFYDGAQWEPVAVKGLGGDYPLAIITDINNRDEFVGSTTGGPFVARPADDTTPGLQPAEPLLNPANGHYYKLVVSPNSPFGPPVRFADAVSAAAASSHLGMPGHLATITSQEEQDFLMSAFGGPQRSQWFWIAASDATVNGEWRWVAGPETGRLFWQGNYTGTGFGFDSWGRAGFSGQRNEPNDADPQGATEDFAALRFELFSRRAFWNDISDVNPGAPRGYIIEYSPIPEPPSAACVLTALVFLRRGFFRRGIQLFTV
jgi:hypothetical protein